MSLPFNNECQGPSTAPPTLPPTGTGTDTNTDTGHVNDGTATRRHPSPLRGPSVLSVLAVAPVVVDLTTAPTRPSSQIHPAPLNPDNPYPCVSQGPDHDSPFQARIGWIDHIARWGLGEVLTYDVCSETFRSQADVDHATAALAAATTMWAGVGVTFQPVPRGHPATFRVVFVDWPVVGFGFNVFARAFLPNVDPNPESRTLFIYPLSFEPAHRHNQAGILAHEVGHILGLRHETPSRPEPWSTQWMGQNPGSVMLGDHRDSSKWAVTWQDWSELRTFLHDPRTDYDGKPIRTFAAPRAVYR